VEKVRKAISTSQTLLKREEVVKKGSSFAHSIQKDLEKNGEPPLTPKKKWAGTGEEKHHWTERGVPFTGGKEGRGAITVETDYLFTTSGGSFRSKRDLKQQHKGRENR